MGCKICGKPLHKGAKLYCSKSCYGVDKKQQIGKKVSLQCLCCSKMFLAYPYMIKNNRRKYCSRECQVESMMGRHKQEGNPRWKEEGYTFITPRGKGLKVRYCRYIKIGTCCIKEHRHIAEQALGRSLKRNEVVHHIDCNPLNNSPRNLLICDNRYHRWLHERMSELYAQKFLTGTYI